MTLRTYILTGLILFAAAGLLAQEEDPTLFTVKNQEVPVSEFRYIYEKTNGEAADYSRKSLEEYLDLYVRFKLKVQRAQDMELDTIPSLQRELEGYRRTLANSYLIDKEITERLVREAYDRSKQDVNISHILITPKQTGIPGDTLPAYREALKIKKRLEDGEDFSRLAIELSDDNSAKQNGGEIGFITALFPDGYYALENAAYTLPVGKISDPVRTSAGYHIIKVNERRPARGEIEAAHLMLRLKDADPDSVKIRIDSIYSVLQKGVEFEQAARIYSEDSYTSEKGGYIGFFGINNYEKAFEDAAFSIAEDGQYTKPVQTSIGWHIIKRISKRDIQPFDIEKRRLQTKVMNDSRHEQARHSMIEKIKKEANFKENREVLDQFSAGLTSEFFTFRWKAAEDARDVLFTLDPDFDATMGEFGEFLNRESRQRASLGRSNDPQKASVLLYDSFVEESIMKYEETRLEQKYPEFKYLMNEYEEGILLFEATQREVWNKASQDTAGLEAFYDKVKNKYRWDERARTSLYRLSAEASDQIDAVRAFAETHDAEEVLAKFNTEENMILSVEEKMLEKTRNNVLIGTPWRVGALSPTKENGRNKILTFLKIEDIVPPQAKSLDEARGYVIAEYQDYLENEWVRELKKEYEVNVNNQVFESLVKE